MPIDLIIFDCDGVLVDSEVISCRAHADVLTKHGYPITSEQVFDRFLGRSMRQATREVEAELGRSLPDDFHAQVYAEIFRSFAASLQATPHISADAGSDCCAHLRRLERPAGEDKRQPQSRWLVRQVRTKYLFRCAGI